MAVKANVQCDKCGEWHTVGEGMESVECSCGTVIAVTITLLSKPTS